MRSDIGECVSPVPGGPWCVFLGCEVEKSETVSWFSGEADHILPTPVCLVPPLIPTPIPQIFHPFHLLPQPVYDVPRHLSGSPRAWGTGLLGSTVYLGGAWGFPLPEKPH